MTVLQLDTYPSRLIRKAIRHINQRNPILMEAYRFILQEEVSSCQHVANNYSLSTMNASRTLGSVNIISKLNARAQEVLAPKVCQQRAHIKHAP